MAIVEVVVPQLSESVAEATLLNWYKIKKVKSSFNQHFNYFNGVLVHHLALIII